MSPPGRVVSTLDFLREGLSDVSTVSVSTSEYGDYKDLSGPGTLFYVRSGPPLPGILRWVTVSLLSRRHDEGWGAGSSWGSESLLLYVVNREGPHVPYRVRQTGRLWVLLFVRAVTR